MAESGAFEGLDPALLAQLEQLGFDAATASLDPARLAADLAKLAPMVQALVKALDPKLAPGMAKALLALAERLARERSSPGRGSVNRGRSDADLVLGGQTEGNTDGLEARRLPPGERPSTDWQVIGVTRAAPKTQPERSVGVGSAGSTGQGEAAPRRRVAPRHRGVVEQFFGDKQ